MKLEKVQLKIGRVLDLIARGIKFYIFGPAIEIYLLQVLVL